MVLTPTLGQVAYVYAVCDEPTSTLLNLALPKLSSGMHLITLENQFENAPTTYPIMISR